MYDNLTRTNLEFAYREAEKRIAELEKACDETQKLLDKQIEVTYKLVEENTELKELHESDKKSLTLIAKKGEELEKVLSNSLSCKNCSENKGGLICQKEYEDKCLAQKIQYIKELKEENENLKKTYRKQRNKRIDYLQKENAELKKQLEMSNKVYNDNLDYSHHIEEHLTKAKKIIQTLQTCLEGHHTNSFEYEQIKQAEEFLKDNKQGE